MLFVAEVVDEDDLVEVLRRRVVQHAPDGAQQRRPRLVREDDDHAHRRQIRVVPNRLALGVAGVGNRPS